MLFLKNRTLQLKNLYDYTTYLHIICGTLKIYCFTCFLNSRINWNIYWLIFRSYLHFPSPPPQRSMSLCFACSILQCFSVKNVKFYDFRQFDDGGVDNKSGNLCLKCCRMPKRIKVKMPKVKNNNIRTNKNKKKFESLNRKQKGQNACLKERKIYLLL